MVERAACRGLDTSWWFGDSFEEAVGVSICRRCPVRQQCLDDALAFEHGTYRYGGLTAEERAIAARVRLR